MKRNEYIDLTDAKPVLHDRVPSNNQEVYYYPEAGEAEQGIIENHYDGYPNQGIVRFDVIGWEATSWETDGEEIEKVPEHALEWIEETVFTTSGRDYGHHLNYEIPRTIEVIDAYEGDMYTVELEVTNKRRIK